MNETKDIKEKVEEIMNVWSENETFTADSTARQYGYLPINMGANIRDLEGRIEKLLKEFTIATKCNVSSIFVRKYNYVNTADDTLTISVTIEK
jgi:hypothetical protein